MARRKRPEPKSPAAILAERNAKRMPDFGAVGLSPDAAMLERNEDVEVTRAGAKREGRRVDEDSARRLDAFSALKEGMGKGAYDAARRLERDLLIRADLADRGRVLIRVDGDGGRGRIDRMIDAGKRSEAVKDLLSDREWLLLELLIYSPMSSQFPDWRSVVKHCTREDNANAQGAVVRAACENLAEVYLKLDGVCQHAA